MTISIITPVLNGVTTIKRTLESVTEQSHPPCELIIIDGYSTDATLSIVGQYTDKLALKVVSQEPKGVYHAMNQGIQGATGDIISILNADDFYAHADVLAHVAQVFRENPEASVVYGDIAYAAAATPDKILRYWHAGEYSLAKLKNGWAMPHPAVFVRRQLYEQAGLFNDTFTIAGDYELMLRWLLVQRVHVAYLPELVTVMEVGGLSSRNIGQRMQGWRELKRAWRVNNLPLPPAFIFRRLLSKIGQFWPARVEYTITK